MFKIISCGWNCAEWIVQTLDSVQMQARDDWECMVVYDASPDNGAEIIEKYCAGNPGWHYQLNPDQRFAVRNQYEGLKNMWIEDDDIIVFLDLDGDELAHPDVLSYLAEAYSDGTLLTYGSYEPVPDPGTTSPAVPFPADVVASNSYREWLALPLTPTSFNHLRTMKGRIFNSIPEDQFHWPDGRWYTIGTDYIFMIPALERAYTRYKCLPETLLFYNHDNPHADYLANPNAGCVVDVLKRPPLAPIEVYENEAH